MINFKKYKNTNKKIIYFIFLFVLNLLLLKYNIYISLIREYIKNKIFVREIQKAYSTFNKVNINEIDNKINKKKQSNSEINSIINIGMTLDKNYVYQTMVTVTSILVTQNKTTKIRFHLGVTQNFTVEKMLKIYRLRNRINNLTEFNFYYLKESVNKMKNFHKKGETLPGKIELPTLLPDDIERLLIFDTGDSIILRDLTDLYNYNMGNYWVLGTVEPTIIYSYMKIKFNMNKYINTGSMLLNVKKLKENNIWEKYTKNRFLKILGQPDQTLFNIIIPDDKKNYIPFKFGGYTLFSSDKNFDSSIYDNFHFKTWFKSNDSLYLPENPKSEIGILANLYNPRFIHQFYGKWMLGKGLSIYRLLVKYFILLTGISGEICRMVPGYCI